MTAHCVPWPRFDRRALLLLLDDQHRVLLCGGCCGSWTVPQVRIDTGADFVGAATGFLADRFGMRDPRFGSGYGLRQSRLGDSWEFERTTASRVLIVRVSDEESAVIEQASATHALLGLDELRRRRREIYPEGVVALATGYAEGLIPDGPISLS
ncbi:hypothetical protein ACFCXA_13805 [Streptomyces virginiae]|uniref:hypothetical protein n=1 Tax=Streptomyces virginiae TaxID=1961 RepID=UPI0035D80359